MTPDHAGSEFRRGWGTLLASCAGLAFGVATLAISYTIGVLMGPLQDEFGWSRAQILVSSTIVSVVVGSLTLGVGWLADRTNVRRLVIGSQLGFGLGFFALGLFVTSLASLYILYFLLALVGVATTAVAFAKLITAQFVKHRGLALGLAMSGSGFCAFAVPPYLSYVVETFGWRAGYFAIGALPLLVALPLTILFIGRQPDSTRAKPTARPMQQVGTDSDFTLKQALVSYRFWATFMIFVLGSCVMTGLITNYVPILQDEGYSATQAATMAGSFGVSVVVGRIVVGFLIDRWWAPLVGCLIFAPAAASIALLAGGGLSTTALVGTILMSGFAAGAEVDLMGFLVARYFGLRHFGKIYAGIYIGFALAPGFTTPLLGAARDHYGNYSAGLYVAAIALVGAALLLVSLGRYPQFPASKPS